MKNDVFFYKKSAAALEFDKVMEILSTYAVCAETKEKIKAFLPLYDGGCVRLLLSQTNAALNLVKRNASIPIAPLSADMLHYLAKGDKGLSLSADELISVGKLLVAAKDMQAFFNDKEGDFGALKLFFEGLYVDEKLSRRIEQTFLPSGAMADDASPALFKLRKEIIRASLGIKEKLEAYIKSPSVAPHLQDPIVTLRSNRYVIPVRADARSDIKGLLHDTSGSGNTLFIEPIFVIEENNRIRKLETEEQNEIKRILEELSAIVCEAAPMLKRSYQTVLSLDFVFAKAKYSYAQDHCIPTVLDKPALSFSAARHPLIDKKVMVPLSTEMSRAQNAIIVTGPNTGGKTVFLKTVGLLSLMLKAGMHLPADAASGYVFERIYADIGDEQSIEQSLSTFSSHMRNIKNIVAQCRRGDLALFDELGSGTDPGEGAALAIAVIEKIRSRHTFTAVTTHYGELKNYALTTDGVVNASFAFDLQNLKPTYRLQMGIPGKSYAFEISKQLGLAGDVIEHAKTLVDDTRQQAEQMIDVLDRQRSEMDQKLREVAEEKKKLFAERKDLESQKKKLLSGADQYVLSSQQKAHHIVETARRQAELLQQELASLRSQMDKATYQNLKSNIRRSSAKLQSPDLPQKKQTEIGEMLKTPPAPGDTVFVPALGKKAIVESVSGKTVHVQSDGIRLRLDVSSLRTATADEAEKTKPNLQVRRAEFNAGVKTELDVRGTTVDEAVEEIDRFIDQAILGKMQQVTVIHGKGTGALRAGVHSFLRTHPSVRAFRLGEFGQGDSGVTVIELK